MSEIELSTLSQELLRCKLEAWQQLNELGKQLEHNESRIDNIEAMLLSVKTDLKKHEHFRNECTLDLKKDIAELREWFSEHDGNEMKKYDKIIEALNTVTESLQSLTIDNNNNKDFVSKVKKYWFALTVGATAIGLALGGLWWIIVQLESRGLLILFPKG